MEAFTPQEMKALKIVIDFAAKHCGGREDTIGAILYTGAAKELPDQDAAVVKLAKKIEGRLLGNDFTGDIAALMDIADRFTIEGNWVEGRIKAEPRLKFCAKIFAEPSHFGLKGGRISKLQVYREGDDGYLEEDFYNYDRGDEWCKKVKGVRSFVNKIAKALQ